MYEPHFGLRARPFATAPDPDFYFESRAHHRALAYLRHGIAERDSFMVMTGEIGAGKTTLVHKLLRELDEREIQVALLVSSQLDARELLGAAASAFGDPAAPAASEDQATPLGRALGALAAQGKRALLVIDEAQNLLPDAIEWLIDFAEPRAAGPFELQVLLVGQPELQERIQHGSSQKHRQTVFIHCHIGCLSEPETRDYIEHRLRHVGWTGSPGFQPPAYERIHAHTDGVPRRINRLCDRLLLSAYLREDKEISARLVDQVDAELRTELGDRAGAALASTAPAAPHARPAAAPRTRPGPTPGRPIPTLSAFVSPQAPGAASAVATPEPAAPWGPSEPAAPPAVQAAPLHVAREPPAAPARPIPLPPTQSAVPRTPDAAPMPFAPARPPVAPWRAAAWGGGMLALLLAAWWLAGPRSPPAAPPHGAPAAGPPPPPTAAAPAVGARPNAPALNPPAPNLPAPNPPAPTPRAANPPAPLPPARNPPPPSPPSAGRAPPVPAAVPAKPGPTPTPGPTTTDCTAAVIALGLCPTSPSPPAPKE